MHNTLLRFWFVKRLEKWSFFSSPSSCPSNRLSLVPRFFGSCRGSCLFSQVCDNFSFTRKWNYTLCLSQEILTKYSEVFVFHVKRTSSGNSSSPLSATFVCLVGFNPSGEKLAQVATMGQTDSRLKTSHFASVRQNSEQNFMFSKIFKASLPQHILRLYQSVSSSVQGSRFPSVKSEECLLKRDRGEKLDWHEQKLGHSLTVYALG